MNVAVGIDEEELIVFVISSFLPQVLEDSLGDCILVGRKNQNGYMHFPYKKRGESISLMILR